MPVVREADPSLEGKQIDKDGRSQGRDAGRYSGADIIWAVGCSPSFTQGATESLWPLKSLPML